MRGLILGVGTQDVPALHAGDVQLGESLRRRTAEIDQLSSDLNDVTVLRRRPASTRSSLTKTPLWLPRSSMV